MKRLIDTLKEKTSKHNDLFDNSISMTDTTPKEQDTIKQ